MDVTTSGGAASSLMLAKATPRTEDTDWTVTVVALLATHSHVAPFAATCNLQVHLGPQARLLDHRFSTPARARSVALEVRGVVPDGLIGLSALGSELVTLASRSAPAGHEIYVVTLQRLDNEWCRAQVAVIRERMEAWDAIPNVTVVELPRTGNHVANYVEQQAGPGKSCRQNTPLRLHVPRGLEYKLICCVGALDTSYSSSCEQLVIEQAPDAAVVSVILFFPNTPYCLLAERMSGSSLQPAQGGDAEHMHSALRSLFQLTQGSLKDAFTQSLSGCERPSRMHRMASLGVRH